MEVIASSCEPQGWNSRLGGSGLVGQLLYPWSHLTDAILSFNVNSATVGPTSKGLLSGLFLLLGKIPRNSTDGRDTVLLARSFPAINGALENPSKIPGMAGRLGPGE